MIAMRRLALAAVTATIASLASLSPARADGTYFSLGFGPGEISDELGQYATDSFGAKIAVGHRLGKVAFEAYVAPEDGERGGYASTVSMLRLGVDVRYLLPVNKNLQFYVRGGLSKMSATLSGAGRAYGDDEFRGRGLGGGAGVQLRGRVRVMGFMYWPMFFVPLGPKVNAALFIDHGVDFYRLHRQVGPARSIDARLTRLTIGLNVGADF